jgi:hypothetical protein
MITRPERSICATRRSASLVRIFNCVIILRSMAFEPLGLRLFWLAIQ